MDSDVTHHDAPKWATTCTKWRDNLSRLRFCVDLKNRSRIAVHQQKRSTYRQVNLSPALLILLIIMKGKDVKDAQTAKGRTRSMAI